MLLRLRLPVRSAPAVRLYDALPGPQVSFQLNRAGKTKGQLNVVVARQATKSGWNIFPVGISLGGPDKLRIQEGAGVEGKKPSPNVCKQKPAGVQALGRFVIVERSRGSSDPGQTGVQHVRSLAGGVLSSRT